MKQEDIEKLKCYAMSLSVMAVVIFANWLDSYLESVL